MRKPAQPKRPAPDEGGKKREYERLIPPLLTVSSVLSALSLLGVRLGWNVGFLGYHLVLLTGGLFGIGVFQYRKQAVIGITKLVIDGNDDGDQRVTALG